MELGQAGTAFWWGILSAVSLPLGAFFGLWLNPSKKWTSSLMSFGAGALLAALTLELVHKSLQRAGFWPLGIGCVVGALLFMFLNSLLADRGGFLRKLSTTVKHIRDMKWKKAESLLDHLSGIGILRAMPSAEMQALIPHLHPTTFPAGEVIFRQGDPGDCLYLIESGEVSVETSGRSSASGIAALGPGDAFGEMALIHDEPRSAQVKAKTDLKTWTLAKQDFDRLIKASPELARAVSFLDEKRRMELDALSEEMEKKESESWATDAKAHLGAAAVVPSEKDIKEVRASHGGGAAMAIWLGILLDGIPESLVIGASMIGSSSVSLSLIVGVFLANFPEALSSAVGMKRQGMRTGKIIWMWTSLMLMTGAGAFIGYLTFGSLSPTLSVLVGGLAAGAMLAMIAETMLPEAAEQGGPANGLMTVLGFLAAVYVGTLGFGH